MPTNGALRGAILADLKILQTETRPQNLAALDTLDLDLLQNAVLNFVSARERAPGTNKIQREESARAREAALKLLTPIWAEQKRRKSVIAVAPNQMHSA
jgi:hypothetical protein